MGRIRARLIIQAAGITQLVALVGLLAGCRAGAKALPPNQVCSRQLERLGVAINVYRREKGCLPENISGATGFMHSWRTQILPYLPGPLEGSRFLAYRLEESWNSANNLKWISLRLPLRFSCPLEYQTWKPGCLYTSYPMLLRRNAGHLNRTTPTPTALPDGAVIIVESVGCKIGFGEARDIDIESLFKGDSPFGVGKLNSFHEGFVRALRLDGKVIKIPKDISKEDLRRLLDGEVEGISWTTLAGLFLAPVLAVGMVTLLRVWRLSSRGRT